MTGCPKASLEALVLGELDPATAAGLQTHVRLCEPCARELDRARTLREALRRRALESEVPLTAIRARVETAVVKKREARRLLRQDGPILAALACAALLIGVSISQIAPHPSGPAYSVGPLFVEDPLGEDALLDQYGVWKRLPTRGACELPLSLPPPDDGRNVCL